jgi:hypothetical protein
VYVIRRYGSSYDHHFPRLADLADEVARTLRHATAQNLVAILCTPDQVILQIEDRVRALPVFRHPLIVAGA